MYFYRTVDVSLRRGIPRPVPKELLLGSALCVLRAMQAICHKHDPSTLLPRDDLSWKDHDNASRSDSLVEGTLLERIQPGGDGPTNLIRRVLLKEVDPTYADLGLRGPALTELAVSSGERASRVPIHE
jgi:hypothetical protein